MTLTKKVKLVYTPATAGTPGDPGAPATPGYYVDVAATNPIRWVLVLGGQVIDTSWSIEKPHPVIGTTQTMTGSYVVFTALSASRTPVWVAVAESSYITRVWVPASAGRPAIPATAGTAAKTATTVNLGWNAGAISSSVRNGDAILALKVSASAIGIVAGMNQTYAQNDYKQIPFGFYFASGRVLVYESGVARTSAVSFSSDDEFQIRRVGTVVSYYQSATLLYTSSEASAGPVFADASLYAAGDRITFAAFIAGDTSDGTDSRDASSDAALPPLSGLASDHDYAEARSTLSALTGYAYDSNQDLQPAYTLGSSELLPLQGFALVSSGKVGQVDSALPALAGIASDTAYTEARSVLQPMTGYGAIIKPITSGASLVMPAVSLYGTGHNSTGETGFKHTLSAPTVKGYGGARLRLTTPRLTLTASVTTANLATARLTMPAVTAQALASTVYLARARLTVKLVPRVFAQGGATLHLPLGAIMSKGSATTGRLAHARLAMPAVNLRCTTTTRRVSGARLTMPAVFLRKRCIARLTMPTTALRATGSTVIVIDYEAYSVNLQHKTRYQGDEPPTDETTHYTNFPFTHVVRYQDGYIGVAADGLYLLGGLTDDGADIQFAVQTCTDGFGAPELKTATAAVFGGRLGPGATVTLLAGETGQDEFTYTTPRGQTAQNHREKLGRGVKNRYFAVGLSGSGVLELDTLDLDISKLTRRI